MDRWRLNYYCYCYSALGPVWPQTRAHSGDWYGFGTLHPGHVLRGSLPLFSPSFWMFPLFTTSCVHVRHDVRVPSGGSGKCGRECCPLMEIKYGILDVTECLAMRTCENSLDL